MPGRDTMAPHPRGDDEGAMFAAYRASRDPAIRNAVACRYLSLVPPIARRFHLFAEPLEDLIQVGYLGLLKAAEQYDAGRDVKFATYATHCIFGAIRHYVRDKSQTVRLPRWLSMLSRKISIFFEQFLQARRRLPTPSEISAALNITEEGVVELLRVKLPASLDAVDQYGRTLVDVDKLRSVSMRTFELPLEERIALVQSIERLHNLEKRVIFYLFYMDLNQIQAGELLGLTQKQVSRMLHRALRKLKDLLTRDLW